MFKKAMKSTHMALFITGAVFVVMLVLAEKFFSLVSDVNSLFATWPVDPKLSMLAIMGAGVVILMSLFSVALSRRMKMKVKM